MSKESRRKWAEITQAMIRGEVSQEAAEIMVKKAINEGRRKLTKILPSKPQRQRPTIQPWLNLKTR